MLGVIDAPIASALAEPPFALATPAMAPLLASLATSLAAPSILLDASRCGGAQDSDERGGGSGPALNLATWSFIARCTATPHVQQTHCYN